jgi:2-phosphosulfolactate phosphatase
MICYVSTHLLPQHVRTEELVGSVAIVIDVLRATTTMVHALSEGASSIIPCAEIDEARQTAAALPTGTAILGGERGGSPIEGFDLGNSPLDYRRERVLGKTLVMTTTNGTRALLHARSADRVLVAAFANLTAVVASLRTEMRSIHILCAGSEGEVSLEDLLLAGAIASTLAASRTDVRCSEESLLARTLFEGSGRLESDRIRLFREARGGRTLRQLGLDADIEFAARADTARVVPQLLGNRVQTVPTPDTSHGQV